MTKIRVKTGDNVFVLSGKDAGKTGKVLAIDPKAGRVIVEGVNMVTKHKKPRGRDQEGGIIKQEASIHSSNVMLVCSKCKRPVKIGHKYLEDGEKVRFCKSCDQVIGTIKSAKRK